MEDARDYSVFPSNLDTIGSFKKVEDFLLQCGYKEKPGPLPQCITFSLRIDENRSLNTYSFEEFLKILQEYPFARPIVTHSHWEKKGEIIKLDIEIRNSEISVRVNAQNLDAISGIHDRIAQIFKARNPIKEKSSSLSIFNLKKTVFLAHRFDEIGNELARRMSTFIRRLGFDIIEGEGYEAREIPNKVSERIKSQDIFICIVTPGDHSWILSEMAFAKGLNKYIVILCQDDISFNKGIVGGDYEHLAFPENQIEITFSDLLYVLPK